MPAEVNVWSPMKNLQLKTWKSSQKSVQHDLRNKIVKLKRRQIFIRLTPYSSVTFAF